MSVLVVQSGAPVVQVSRTQPVIVLTSGLLNSGTAGAVTSVALTAPSDLTVTGSPVTGAGTLAITRNAQSANQFLAGPSSGAAAVPAYRALVSADLPASGVTAGSYGAAGVVASLTVDATGRITGASDVTITPAAIGAASTTSGYLTAAEFPALTGDLTTPAGSLATTLATSGVTAGTYGSSTQVGQFTVDAKGRITAASNVTIPGTGTTFTFVPQGAPTLAAGITWGDSTQQALQTYINGAKGWLPTVLMVGTGITTISLPASAATSIMPSTSIGTATLPANFLVAGKTLKINIRGYVSTAPSAQSIVTPKLIVGATTIGATNNGTGFETSSKLFSLEYTLTCLTTGTTGTVMTSLNAGADGNQTALAQVATMWSDQLAGASSTVDTTVANTLNVTLNCTNTLTIKVTHAMIEVIA